ncbi:Cytosolic 5'-nucleotidase 1B [Larimichthys crocea]|uniref:Cytosolic 5'-nucleotidase 1B n=1 Tax=Larimichthys crocea TaxID=215358 RepID=A0A6G0I5D4_LARCR|nr:Cytosolic 5'-nucleotidase 1B [Larimichthys crocea]
MSEIKPNESAPAPAEDNGEEKDWAAAKAFFDNLKTHKPRPPKPRYAVTIAVSSRTLFNMVAERKIYEEEDLTIERFCMTGGQSPIGYLKAYMTNLYLSKDSEKVGEAIEEGIAAATMFMPKTEMQLSDTQLRVAFDGDAVLFSDESEIIVKKHGLDTFFEHEKEFENKPLAQGPLKCFLEALGKLQRKFYAKDERLNCPIRTFLVTARSAASSGARVLKTLRSWGLEIDEALFLAGAPKGPLLQKIKPHIYFDDQMFHIEGAKELGTISAHVPYGIGQKYNRGKLIESEKKE